MAMSDSARLEIVLSDEANTSPAAAPEALSPAATAQQPLIDRAALAAQIAAHDAERQQRQQATQRTRVTPADDDGPRVNYLTGKAEDPAANAAAAARKMAEWERLQVTAQAQ